MLPARSPTSLPEPAAPGARPSVFAEDLEVEGDVRSTGPIHLQGRLTGSLTGPEVLVESTGTVQGDVTARICDVHGRVDGHIAAERVKLAAASVVRADIEHK